jgi:hypothetical protein
MGFLNSGSPGAFGPTRSIQAMVTVAAVAGRERGIGSGDRPNQFGAQPASRARELGQLARGADLGLDKRRGH